MVIFVGHGLESSSYCCFSKHLCAINSKGHTNVLKGDSYMTSFAFVSQCSFVLNFFTRSSSTLPYLVSEIYGWIDVVQGICISLTLSEPFVQMCSSNQMCLVKRWNVSFLIVLFLFVILVKPLRLSVSESIAQFHFIWSSFWKFSLSSL